MAELEATSRESSTESHAPDNTAPENKTEFDPALLDGGGVLIDSLPLPERDPDDILLEVRAGDSEQDLFGDTAISDPAVVSSPSSDFAELVTSLGLNGDPSGQVIFNKLFYGAGGKDYDQTYAIAREQFGITAADMDLLVHESNREKPISEIFPVDVSNAKPAIAVAEGIPEPAGEIQPEVTHAAVLPASLSALGLEADASMRDVYNAIYRTEAGRNDAETYALIERRFGITAATMEENFSTSFVALFDPEAIAGVAPGASAAVDRPIAKEEPAVTLTGQALINKYHFAAKLLGSPGGGQWSDAVRLAARDGIDLSAAANDRAGDFVVSEVQSGRAIASRASRDGIRFSQPASREHSNNSQPRNSADDRYRMISESTAEGVLRKETLQVEQLNGDGSASPGATREIHRLGPLPLYSRTTDSEGRSSRRILGFIPLPGQRIDKEQSNVLKSAQAERKQFERNR